MTLALLIQKGGLQRLATATVATAATVQCRATSRTVCVATVASVAVANPPPPDAENIREWWQERAAIMAADGGLADEQADTLAWVRTMIHFHLPAGYRLH